MGTGSSTNSDNNFDEDDQEGGGQLYVSLKMENYKVKDDLVPHVYGSVPLIGSLDTTKALPMQRESISTWELSFVVPPNHETLAFKFLLKPKYCNTPCIVEDGADRLLTRGTLQGDARLALFRINDEEVLEYKVLIKADRVSPFDLAASWRAYQENLRPSTVRGIPDVSINPAPQVGGERKRASMVGGKRRGRPRKQAAVESKMNEPPAATEYEQLRQQNIKENLQKMEKMGIFDLSRKLTSEIKPPASKKSKTCPAKTTLPSSDTTRRSSRLTTIARVDYAEKVRSPTKAARGASNNKRHLKQGSEPEIYTAEHEKLLRDCNTKWALYADQHDKHGKRIYDPIDGKCCHQCRQKTIGRHTECSSCKTRSGQFCGDCLFMRYGENVIEVNKNSEWICPVCRGICNCSRCRLQKGWKPTGSIYRKVKNLGFKSVAHYLIQTRQAQTIQEEPT